MTKNPRALGAEGSARLAVGLVMLGLFLTVCAASGDEFDTLRYTWRTYLVGPTNLDISDSIISSRVSSVSSSCASKWSSMNKAADRTYLWSEAASTTISAHLTTCYNNILAMAQGYVMTGSTYRGNTNLANDISGALDWMYANRYNEGKTKYNNWWDWEIGVPMALNNVMVLMHPLLSPTQISNYCAAIDKFSPTVTMTGANRVWKAYAVGVRGAVGGRADKVAAARDGLSDAAGGGASSVFTYVTSGDGFYRDGSFIQHGRHPYTGGYGTSLMRELVKIMTWVDGTTWQVTDVQRSNVVRWCFDSYEPMIYRGGLADHLRGREISRSSTAYSSGHAAINAMLRLAPTVPGAEADRLYRALKYWSQSETIAASGLPGYADIDLIPSARALLANGAIPSRGELIGHYGFPSMDRVMHLRPGFGFGLSMFSTRVYNYESINSENLHGWYTSAGMTWLWNGDLTQFSDSYWPTVDPYHLPGTTVLQSPLANGANQSKTGSQPWVGGSVLSNSFGVTGMALYDVNSSLRGFKSWFMFDDEVVCLGAGITAAGTTNVHTTVENRRLNSSGNNVFTAGGVVMPTSLGWTSNLVNVSWCALDGAGGYYFPVPVRLAAAREARVGRWADINANGSVSSITRNYLSLVLDHGVKPTNAVYAYVILPNASGAETAAYAGSPEFTVLTNTPEMQAVRENSLDIVGANFWSSAGGAVDILRANRPASVMARISSNILEVAVADPTWTNSQPILVTINRRGTQIISYDTGVLPGALSPIQLAFNVSGARGRTLQARIEIQPAPLAVPDEVETSMNTPVTLDPVANDAAASAPISLVSVGSPASGSVSTSGNEVTYTPAPGYGGTDTFGYTITDGSKTSSSSISVIVGPERFAVSAGQVTASTYQDPNVPENIFDGDLNTRWSAEGVGQWLEVDLGTVQKISAASVAFYQGNSRTGNFDLHLQNSGTTNWNRVFTGRSSGTTTNLERYDFPDAWARYVRFTGYTNSANAWNSVTELQIHPGTNSAPIAVNDSGIGFSGKPMVLDILANDADPDDGPVPLKLVSWTFPAHGSVTATNTALLYQPALGYAGADTFTYTITDGGRQSTAGVALTMTNPEPPGISGKWMGGNGFLLTITGEPGFEYRLLASSNLAHWNELLLTNNPAMPLRYVDSGTLAGPRFYRCLLQ